MLKQTHSQKLSQKLIPKIILQQKLLAIPMLSLDNIIKKELELNPMLEEGNEQEPEEEQQTPTLDEEKSDITANNDGEVKSEVPEEASYEKENDSFENKMKEEYDWDEYFETEAEEYKSYDSAVSYSYDNTNVSEEDKSLSESLLLQLHLSELSEKLIFVGEEIIGSLGDDGYFADSPEAILEDLNFKKKNTKFENEEFTIEDFNETLDHIQKSFDPAGIAARNLQECLLIQIHRSDKEDNMKKISSEVVKNHLDDLRLKRFEKISKELNLELSEVKKVMDFIHKINPKPGQTESGAASTYIIPEVTVKKVDDNFEIFLNERFTPSIRINRDYKELYVNDKKNLDKDTKEYLVNNFNRAKWFIDAINSRRETILKVMKAIMDRQRPFFENNGEGLLPLTENLVADDIKMDSSTVSRTVRGKYVQTDFGIYELRSFFTSSISTSDGDELSNKEAKVKLKALIDSENKNSPMSDEELAAEMNKLGVRIARRTVAKYRESMNLPIAKLRREI